MTEIAVDTGSLAIGIAIGAGLALLIYHLIKQQQKGSVVELQRNREGRITEIMERQI